MQALENQAVDLRKWLIIGRKTGGPIGGRRHVSEAADDTGMEVRSAPELLVTVVQRTGSCGSKQDVIDADEMQHKYLCACRSSCAVLGRLPYNDRPSIFTACNESVIVEVVQEAAGFFRIEAETVDSAKIARKSLPVVKSGYVSFWIWFRRWSGNRAVDQIEQVCKETHLRMLFVKLESLTFSQH